MALSPLAAATLDQEARSLLSRLDRVRPFALIMPTVAAARIPAAAGLHIERHLLAKRRELRGLVARYVRWLARSGRSVTPAEAQRRYAFLRLKFNAVLTQLDIFADVLTQRGEHENGVWLAGLDAVAADALALPGQLFEPPPVMTYLDRGHGAAIRRARTRLPGGGDNPVAIVRVPRERMVGSGIASSLVHEVGHQGAALLDLVGSLRRALSARARGAEARRAGGEAPAWRLWERWISEIVADFWSLARVGVAATQGLMGVVSLPRAFVFRINTDDPHPFPWIRVKLSVAFGQTLFPHPQWRRLDRLWEAFYPRAGLDPRSLRTIRVLEATLPSFVELVAHHRPARLQGRSLRHAFPLSDRQPWRLQNLFAHWQERPSAMLTAPPTLVFAVLGQARQDRLLGPAEESRTVARLLTRWALARAVKSGPAASRCRCQAA